MVVRRIYSRGTQTSGIAIAIDDIRDILFDAGMMNSNSDLVEWSTSGTDRQKLKIDHKREHTPKGLGLTANTLKKMVLPGFRSMSFILLLPVSLPGLKASQTSPSSWSGDAHRNVCEWGI